MLKDTLLTLLSIPGPSGSEGACADYIEETVRPYVDQIDRDVMGNLICIKHAAEGARRVMLTAHMDEIGFIVTAIEERGFLRVTNIGGVNPKVTTASHVVMKSGAQGVLFTEAGSSNDALFIDIGASSKEEAEKKAQVGDWAVVRGVVSDMGDKIAAPYLDDRSGCAVLIETLKRLKNSKDEIIAVFTTQEEVGLRGAKITAERLRPALAICLEGTPADDNFTAPDEAQGALKKGVQIRFRDGSMVAHPGLVAFARRVAEENNIPHQCAVRTGGGTNGGSIHLAPGGVPTLVLGIPVRYAHTHYGYSAAADVDAAIALACAILRALTPDVLRLLNPMA